ncbi:MAG TPA: hypothetical protein VLF39_00230 [Candidatus Saccharimonadales bacterium]|nr:hypothetical protein [Candidatus Saccharimonadales bacterium]
MPDGPGLAELEVSLQTELEISAHPPPFLIGEEDKLNAWWRSRNIKVLQLWLDYVRAREASGESYSYELGEPLMVGPTPKFDAEEIEPKSSFL